MTIYSYLFADEWVYISPCDQVPEFQLPLHQQEHLPAIVRTCQELQEEAIPVYYSSVQVHFDMFEGSRPTHLIGWLNDIGSTNAKLVQHFEMRWNNYADITLDLQSHRSRLHRTQAEDDAVKIYTYHQHLSTFLQHIKSTKRRNGMQQLYTPLLQLRTSNATTSTHFATSYDLEVKGVPLSTALHPSEFWSINGTAEFCRTLSRSLADWLDHILTARGAFESVGDLVDFIMLADDHASALRWLGYW